MVSSHRNTVTNSKHCSPSHQANEPSGRRMSVMTLCTGCAGCTNNEVSAWLRLLPNTVKFYFKHAIRKLDVTNRVQPVNRAPTPSCCADHPPCWGRPPATGASSGRVITASRPRCPLTRRDPHMFYDLGDRDFLDRAESVYPDRVAVVDEPAQPAESWRSATYRELARRARAQAANRSTVTPGTPWTRPAQPTS
ncbi:helix-turn-helix domain-containing protein [Nonomuraea sp. H19]|uniref:helix-turn-helix domain-containing protein n=1 Tax=Nonomuraea sp. H19 TaxID=3452206 RepID=UPI003F896EA8